MFAQNKNYQLSSHILDVSKGTPASNISIKLENSNLGIFKLTYYTSDYFKLNNTESFYPFIEVVFQIKDQNHYHVPITLSAFGYSTYRGN